MRLADMNWKNKKTLKKIKRRKSGGQETQKNIENWKLIKMKQSWQIQLVGPEYPGEGAVNYTQAAGLQAVPEWYWLINKASRWNLHLKIQRIERTDKTKKIWRSGDTKKYWKLKIDKNEAIMTKTAGEPWLPGRGGCQLNTSSRAPSSARMVLIN